MIVFSAKEDFLLYMEQFKVDVVNAISEKLIAHIDKLVQASLEETISMEEAAKILGVRYSSRQSLSCTFSKLGDARVHPYPLPSDHIGKQRYLRRARFLNF